ncbi:hypothetical protein GQ44DRAFT_611479 [Phaeosphaeriaceae sp. PMI808]|nr:hypothetical protein GQ44DRAFT_611479 [Phaeosphaeriaceae sp. PMI808]
MADALCGPSNALQNFQKHTTVDRTLQQDRLIGRHSPSQGFRTSSGLNTGALDSEFNAFQAGRPATLPQDFHHAPQFVHPPPPQFAQAPQAPGWASDFQRLNISGSPVQSLSRPQPQAANAGASWHQDFMMQQTPAIQAPALQSQSAYGGVLGYSMGGMGGMSAFGGQSFLQPSGMQSSGKQPVQEAAPVFDEAAFEQAFLQAEHEAQQDALGVEAEQAPTQAAQANQEPMSYDRPGEMDPLLFRIRETRPAVYSAIQVWTETGLGRTEEAVTYLDNMSRLEQDGQLVQDANEAKWIVDSLQRIVNRDAPQEVKTRADSLITAINQRLMSQYPLTAQVPMKKEQIWGELEAAGYMRSPELERVEQQPEPEKEKQPQINDDNEMAATAGRLLEKVADNTSEKFQNSQFLSLMRRLRDREVRVEEDKIVQVSDQINGTASTNIATQQAQMATSMHQPIPPSTQIPPIDPTILNHADTTFSMPDYPQSMEQSQ